MGVVYRARQLELDRDVAIKVISPDRVADDRARRRFLSEARAAAAVEHPNVLPVYGAGLAGDHAFIVMRYVPGDDLRMLVRLRGPLEPEHAAAIAVALGGALDAIHRAGFVHRDVKPANVLIGGDDHVYLSDFGLAKEALASGGLTESGRWVGSLDFAAPEQIRGGEVDHRADVYALGGVLHYMLTGAVPYDRPSDEAKLWAHLSDVPPRPSAVRPELPRAFDEVVERAMAKDPADRYEAVGDVGRAARAAAGGASIGFSGSRTRVHRRRPRTRIAAIAGAAAVLAVAGGTAELIAGGGGGDPENRRSPEPTSTTAPEPPGPHIGRTIPGLGRSPRDIAVAQGDVWIISAFQSRVMRYRAATMEKHGRQPAIGRGAVSIASDGDTIWIAISRRNEVVALDARTGRRRDPIPIHDSKPIAVAAAGGSLWIAGRRFGRAADILYRYSPDGRPIRRKEVRGDIDALTSSKTTAWVAQDVSAQLLGFDASLRRTHRAYLQQRAKQLAYGGDRVWMSERDADTLGRYNPVTRHAFQPRIGPLPAGLAYADGKVFIVSSNASRLYVVDPRTLKLLRSPIRLPTNPWAVEAGAGHVWVTSMAAGKLTRIDY
jgi:outer membrane protein assembly factor BamB